MTLLHLILSIIDKGLDLLKFAMEGQTPAQRAVGWQRWFDSTEWMFKLGAKISDDFEDLIDKTPKPPAPPPGPPKP